MRISTVFISAVLVSSLVVTACGGDSMDADAFDTLLACFDEHHNMESLSTHDSIVVCCLDHPIAGVHPSCKDTQADCVAHVTAELGSAASASDIQAACTDYIAQK